MLARKQQVQRRLVSIQSRLLPFGLGNRAGWDTVRAGKPYWMGYRAGWDTVDTAFGLCVEASSSISTSGVKALATKRLTAGAAPPPIDDRIGELSSRGSAERRICSAAIVSSMMLRCKRECRAVMQRNAFTTTCAWECTRTEFLPSRPD